MYAAIAITVGDVDLVRHRVDGEVGRLAEILRVGAAASRPGFAELRQKLSFAREFEQVRVVLAVTAHPHLILAIDEQPVLDLRPVVALAGSAPRVNQRAGLIELENGRRRNAAVGFRRRVARPCESLVATQRAGALRDVDMVLSIDGHAADSADGPVLRQRLRERRVEFEDRYLTALRRGVQNRRANGCHNQREALLHWSHLLPAASARRAPVARLERCQEEVVRILDQGAFEVRRYRYGAAAL